MSETVQALCAFNPEDIATESFTLGSQRVYCLRHTPTGASASDRVQDGEPLTDSLRERILSWLAIEVLSKTMTADKWRRCPDAKPMLKFLDGRAKRRKLRLFACAMCRLSVHLLVGLDGEELLREAEEAADEGGNETTIRLPNEAIKEYAASHSINARGRQAQQGEVEASHLLQTCRDTVAPISQTEWPAAWHNAMFAAGPFAWADPHPKVGGPVDQVAAVRDVFGNPFREPAFSRSWRSDTVLALAKQMYEARDFGTMPILADALEDSRCDSADILAHCRDMQASHVRGCWVVDLVLGKE